MTASTRPPSTATPVDSPPPCVLFPSERRYATADEVSVSLRNFFTDLVERGESRPDLGAYACTSGGVEHYHLGRQSRRMR